MLPFIKDESEMEVFAYFHKSVRSGWVFATAGYNASSGLCF